MDAAFWHERWARGEIGFHRDAAHPMLAKHWPALAPKARDPVLVPLCGKSADLAWLADRGLPVVGVELSEAAVRAFFEARQWTPDRCEYGGLPALRAGRITLCIGDFFAFSPPSPFRWFYDRAAMIALPASMRPAYRRKLGELLDAQARGLLITLVYHQAQMDGPPFSIDRAELDADPWLAVRLLAQTDVHDAHPGFAARGVDSLIECALDVRPRGGD